MRASLLLADAAQVAADKLYVLGAGWTWTGPGPSSFALAVLVEVPWDQTNRQHHWSLQLVDGDGEPVFLPVPDGAEPLRFEGGFEVGRPPGAVPGESFNVPITVSLTAVPLPPGQRMVWLLTVDDETKEEWRLAFNTRATPAPAPGPGP